MTARQQLARLLPLVLLVVLVIAGLRGVVPKPGWNGPLRGYGVAIGIALEFIFGALLVIVRRRDAAARRAAEAAPHNPPAADADSEPPQALRFVLRYVLGAGMLGIAAVLLTNLHLHFLARPSSLPPPNPRLKTPPKQLPRPGGGGSVHIPIGPILYALLVIAIVAAVVASIWWSTRLRRPAAPLVIEDVSSEELRAAVDEGRAAIIACYVAMERRLADRGTARGAADTPDELLSRAVAAGLVRGGAAGRLTALFYEARFSSHPLGAGQREAASAALDELAAELAARQAAEEAAEAEAAAKAAASAGNATQSATQSAAPG